MQSLREKSQFFDIKRPRSERTAQFLSYFELEIVAEVGEQLGNDR